MSFLHLAMKRLNFEVHVPNLKNGYRGSVYHLGEGLYTLTTSNHVWPKGVTLREMHQVRNDIFSGCMR